MRVVPRMIAVASGVPVVYGSQRLSGISLIALPLLIKKDHSSSGLVRSGANRQLIAITAIAS